MTNKLIVALLLLALLPCTALARDHSQWASHESGFIDMIFYSGHVIPDQPLGTKYIPHLGAIPTDQIVVDELYFRIEFKSGHYPDINDVKGIRIQNDKQIVGPELDFDSAEVKNKFTYYVDGQDLVLSYSFLDEAATSTVSEVIRSGFAEDCWEIIVAGDRTVGSIDTIMTYHTPDNNNLLDYYDPDPYLNRADFDGGKSTLHMIPKEDTETMLGQEAPGVEVWKGERVPSGKKLIVLIHGWNPSGNLNHYAPNPIIEESSLESDDTDRNDFAWEHLAGNLLLYNPTVQNDDWVVARYDWHRDASTGIILTGPISNSNAARDVAYVHGAKLGKILETLAPTSVQLVAHSAGNWVAKRASEYLNKQFQGKIQVQVTSLDPYVNNADAVDSEYIDDNIDLAPNFELMSLWADRLDNYYADDFKTDSLGWTSNRFQSHNICPSDWVNIQIEDQDATYESFMNNHAGPIYWYARSAIDVLRESFVDTNGDAIGFPYSLAMNALHLETDDSMPLAAGVSHSLAVAVTPSGSLRAWGKNEYGQLGDGTTATRQTPVLVAADFVVISAGALHTLGVKKDGTLWSWGRNHHGQLGDGSTIDRHDPIQVGSGYVAVAAGGWHSIGLKADGTLWSWGYNAQGQLGDGTVVERSTPVQIGSGFAKIMSGDAHCLALKTDGTLWAWGYNEWGQLGDGSNVNRLVPVLIGSGYTAIAAGGWHSLAVKSDGSLWGWGDNPDGQIGDGTTTRKNTPVEIGQGFSKIRAGLYHSLGIKTDGTLWSWGYNEQGQLGDGSTTSRSVPTRVGSGFKAMAAGGFHSLGLKTDGTIWAWGYNEHGQLGDGTTLTRKLPVEISNNIPTDDDSLPDSWELEIFGNLNQTDDDDADDDGLTNLQEYVLSTNPIKSDSDNDGMDDKWEADNKTAPLTNDAGADPDDDGATNLQEYEAGTDPQDSASVPAATNKASAILPAIALLLLDDDATVDDINDNCVAIAAGSSHSLGIKSDGTLWAWGDNGLGRLGDGTFTDRYTPVQVGNDFKSVFAGDQHSLGIKTNGTLWAWGSNGYGQLGDGSQNCYSRPVQVGSGYTTVSASTVHSLGIKADGTLWAWGKNSSGELGDGTTWDRHTPVQVGNGFKTVSAGTDYSLGIKTDGTLWAWGGNGYGRLGDGTTTDRLTPVQVGNGFKTVSAGSQHALGIKTDGTLWAWGRNFNGQLGDGTTTNRYSPVQVGSRFTAVSAGFSYSLGVKSDGTLWAWGNNTYGKLGDGTVLAKKNPVQIGSGFVAVSAGRYHSLGLKSDGSLWAWGSNLNGDLGDGTTTDRHIPTQTLFSR